MVDPTIMRALVRQFGAEATREVLHAAVDSLVDDAASAVAPKPRRVGQRPAKVIPNVPVDDLSAEKARRKLRAAGLL